jgi:hypothetical protein
MSSIRSIADRKRLLSLKLKDATLFPFASFIFNGCYAKEQSFAQIAHKYVHP